MGSVYQGVVAKRRAGVAAVEDVLSDWEQLEDACVQGFATSRAGFT